MFTQFLFAYLSLLTTQGPATVDVSTHAVLGQSVSPFAQLSERFSETCHEFVRPAPAAMTLANAPTPSSPKPVDTGLPNVPKAEMTFVNTKALAPELVSSGIPMISAHPSLLGVPLELTVALAPSANDIVGKVQGYYNRTKEYTAGFQQEVTNQTFNKFKPKVSIGKVYILKPGRMRWDYKGQSGKTTKSFISDSKNLWAVMHENKQYYKQPLQNSTLPVAVSFLMGEGSLLKSFNAALDTSSEYGSKSDYLLKLTPKAPSAQYKTLWLVVDKSNYAVKKSIVLNTKGDLNEISFSRVKTKNTGLKKSHFIFNAKANPSFRLVQQPEAPAPSPVGKETP